MVAQRSNLQFMNIFLWNVFFFFSAFWGITDLVLVNSFCIYHIHHPEVSHRDFLVELFDGMIQFGLQGGENVTVSPVTPDDTSVIVLGPGGGLFGGHDLVKSALEERVENRTANKTMRRVPLKCVSDSCVFKSGKESAQKTPYRFALSLSSSRPL
jgi:hypothetical protein